MHATRTRPIHHGRPGRRALQRGGTFLGLVLGLIVGLAIAVIVALYITRAPSPFRSAAPAKSTPGNVATPLPQPQAQQPQEPVDPNQPLWSRVPATPTTRTPEATHPADGTRPVPPVTSTTPASQPAAKPAEKPAEKPVAEKPTEKPVFDPIAEIAREDSAKVGYLLQIGAYRSKDDAARQKANLAMQGYESTITEREVNGVMLYRVRVGPYKKLEDMNKARDRLQSSGFEASVIRFTK